MLVSIIVVIIVTVVIVVVTITVVIVTIVIVIVAIVTVVIVTVVIVIAVIIIVIITVAIFVIVVIVIVIVVVVVIVFRGPRHELTRNLGQNPGNTESIPRNPDQSGRQTKKMKFLVLTLNPIYSRGTGSILVRVWCPLLSLFLFGGMFFNCPAFCKECNAVLFRAKRRWRFFLPTGFLSLVLRIPSPRLLKNRRGAAWIRRFSFGVASRLGFYCLFCMQEARSQGCAGRRPQGSLSCGDHAPHVSGGREDRGFPEDIWRYCESVMQVNRVCFFTC